ncbi:Putative glutamine amidotransferase [Saliniradius amylolyticus]|uniref:Glutamine amidotransferase n=1 Tax=Saliniradius amylolyticus TaxID=2183582 RepID=A0A2S2E0Y6_9ALTE|nr:gamma-glutamyl-gamma-aminobutyrate hydrolase family protein [Saliniradius amylolyticus]AWL11259.1 Putative glutamine amidotransferase [Saliniradius amylolyticus]
MAQDTQRNTSKPVIGVTGNARRWSPSWYCIRLSVWLAGGIARRISVRHELPEAHLDGLVISGGDDIHPELYEGEVAPKGEYDEARDALEQRYIRYALEQHLPVLGICRGYQLINVTLGGRLYEDIRPLRRKTSNFGTVLPRKTARLQPGSLLKRWLKASQVRINSLHQQAVKETGQDLTTSAYDLDGFIQATENHSTPPILGVQWHPEYLFYLSRQRRLFHWLVIQAKRFQAREN